MGKGSVSSPYRTDNFVFIGSADGHIYCIDAGNAKEIWRFHTDHQVSGSPTVYKESHFIVGQQMGICIALNIEPVGFVGSLPPGALLQEHL